MSQTTELLILLILLAVVALSVLIIRRRQRADRRAVSTESPYAVSTEGEKRCPNCGMFNLSTARDCVSCHRRLPG
jgi:hypothetical protein